MLFQARWRRLVESDGGMSVGGTILEEGIPSVQNGWWSPVRRAHFEGHQGSQLKLKAFCTNRREARGPASGYQKQAAGWVKVVCSPIPPISNFLSFRGCGYEEVGVEVLTWTLYPPPGGVRGSEYNSLE